MASMINYSLSFSPSFPPSLSFFLPHSLIVLFLLVSPSPLSQAHYWHKGYLLYSKEKGGNTAIAREDRHAFTPWMADFKSEETMCSILMWTLESFKPMQADHGHFVFACKSQSFIEEHTVFLTGVAAVIRKRPLGCPLL